MIPKSGYRFSEEDYAPRIASGRTSLQGIRPRQSVMYLPQNTPRASISFGVSSGRWSELSRQRCTTTSGLNSPAGQNLEVDQRPPLGAAANAPAAAPRAKPPPPPPRANPPPPPMPPDG